MIRSNGMVYVWKKRVKFITYCPTLATVKCEGWNNLMVWGHMGWNNMGMLIEVKEKMNANQYCQILGDRMVVSRSSKPLSHTLFLALTQILNQRHFIFIS